MPRSRVWKIAPLYGFKIDLIGFRCPEDDDGAGLDVVRSSHSTLFRDALDEGFGDSADELGVMVEAASTRLKEPGPVSCFSDSRGGVGGLGLGAAAGSGRGSEACPRDTMTASSSDKTSKLHRDAAFRPGLLHHNGIRCLHSRWLGPKAWASSDAHSLAQGRLQKRDLSV